MTLEKLNTVYFKLQKVRWNRYLENVLHRVVVGNLKIQNSQTAYRNADELVFDRGHVWKHLLWVVRISFNR